MCFSPTVAFLLRFGVEQDRKDDKRKRAASSSVSELDTSKEYRGSEGESLSDGSSLSQKNKRKKKKKSLHLDLELN